MTSKITIYVRSCIDIVLSELLTITLTEVGSKKREEIRKQTESITERKILTYGRSFGVVGKFYVFRGLIFETVRNYGLCMSSREIIDHSVMLGPRLTLIQSTSFKIVREP